jgi:hypothetical protein
MHIANTGKAFLEVSRRRSGQKLAVLLNDEGRFDIRRVE